MNKSLDAFRTISEVADELDVPKHVLRFWEVKFPQLKPMKRGGGRRYYRPEDVVLLRGIRHLLHAEGYTIKGVQKILREQGIDEVKAQAAASMKKSRRGADKADAATPRADAGRIRKLDKAKLAVGRQPRGPDVQAAVEAAIRELEVCRALLNSLGEPQPAAAEDASAKRATRAR